MPVNPYLLGLLGLNLLALVVLFLRQRSLSAELRNLQSRSQALANAPELPAELTRLAREGNAMLSIRILNPMELAAQKHWVAGAAGRLAPSLVRKIVCQEAVKIVCQELPKYGVVAEVKVVGSGG